MSRCTILRLGLLISASRIIVECRGLKVRESHIRDTTPEDQEKRRKRKPFLMDATFLYKTAGTVSEPEDLQPAPTTLDVVYKLFRDNFIMRPPRDLWEGFVDAVSNVQRGCWGAVCGVIDAGWEGYTLAGVPGLLGGGMYGLAMGALLATGGVAAGVYQLLQGINNTPLAIQESNHGKTWEAGHWHYYSMDEDDRELDQELSFLQSDSSRKRSRQLRQRSRRKVKDKEFYYLLKVPTDASQSDIKRAYYREALRTHPDKNVNDQKANQRFQQLSLAYRTLSNDETRDAYDQKGNCFVDPDLSHLDSYTFFAVMFGSYLVEPYVGELKIASLVDSFLQLTDTSRLKDHAADLDHASVLKQKRRALDIALHLRERLARYVAGVQSETEFRASCQLEAVGIARSDFGDIFLVTIGRALMVEGRKFLGKHTSVLGLQGAAASIQATTADMIESYQTLVALCQSVASSVGPVMEAFVADSNRQKQRSSSSNADSCNDGMDGQKKVDTMMLIQKLERTLPNALRLVWQLNDRDIRLTLKDATDKLLRDRATHDVRLARARGLMILGNEFYQMGLREKRKDRWQDTESLKRSMGSAFEAAVQAGAGFYD